VDLSTIGAGRLALRTCRRSVLLARPALPSAVVEEIRELVLATVDGRE
jgi:hypothetical protein